MVAYLIYIAIDDVYFRTAYLGGKHWEKWRRYKCWNYFRDYFPMSLVKTANLDPDKNYVFGYHPHGVISMGMFSNFLTEATGFSEHFPGIKMHVMALNTVVRIPFSREMLMWCGTCSANKESCEYVLSKPAGNGILIAVGGAQEALDAHPKTLTLTISSRFGFVKVALKNGASLVPIIAFGENDLFQQVSNPKGSFFRNLQDTMQKTLGFSVPLIYGRGIFNYDFGLLPHRRPVICVVGEPVPCPKIKDPTEQQTQEHHSRYLKALQELYDNNKDKYFKDRKKDLELR